MRRDPKSLWRMAVCVAAGFILAGVAELIIDVLRRGTISWQPVLQVAVSAALIGLLVVSLYERGFLYTLVGAVGVAIAAGVFTDFYLPGAIQVLLALGFEILCVSFIFIGDRICQSRRVLRILAGILGGIISVSLAFGITVSLISNTGFFKGIIKNIHHVLVLAIVPSLAMLFTRLVLGEREITKPEEELE